jgi:hypothetical protein
LRPGYTGTWRWTVGGQAVGSIAYSMAVDIVTLRYTTNGAGVMEPIRLERTPCNYGGHRTWFRCPRCARRVALLYLRSGRFACRHCQQVAYTSQSEDSIGRSWRRQGKLEKRLSGSWSRPRGMHAGTYERLLAAVIGCEELRDRAIAMYLLRHGLHLEDWAP